MRLIVNDIEIFSNLDIESLNDNVKEMLELETIIKGEKMNIGELPPTFTYKLNLYQLPSLFTKMIKGTRQDMIIECDTTIVDKLSNNLPGGIEYMPLFNNGDRIRIFLKVLSYDRPLSFHQLSMNQKLELILHLKGMAAKFYGVIYIYIYIPIYIYRKGR